ncbi:Growth arrest-specific protein 7 [Sciurus carolinensis]|uniref:Growth arrest-specific protein 7 n=1 Tax=Sciurus carolinensis TaxID=30640 RepID=A0AA41T2Q6_SCICA|nr:Growth arrest-specific protein 7 [Sciurus carolinensis]
MCCLSRWLAASGKRRQSAKDMKNCDHHNADLCKQLTSCNAFVEKAQKALTDWQRDLEMKTQQLEIKMCNKKEDMHGESPTGPHALISCFVWTSTTKPSTNGLKRW